MDDSLKDFIKGKMREFLDQMADQLTDQFIGSFSSEIQKLKSDLEMKMRAEMQKKLKNHIKTLQNSQQQMGDIVTLNVGGVVQQTALSTLTKFKDSKLARMFSQNLPVYQDDEGRYFLDYDGRAFKHVLDYLRTGSLVCPQDEEKLLLVQSILADLQIPMPAYSADEQQQQSAWCLDPSTAGQELELSNGNLTVEDIGQSGICKSVIGNVGFRRGTHQWCVQVDNLDQDSGLISFGVIQKSKFNGSYDINDSYSLSTTNYMYGGLIGNIPAQRLRSGSKFMVALDCDAGELTIAGEGVCVSKVGLHGLELFPYFNLFNATNKVTITFE